jgi:hypothetical protein
MANENKYFIVRCELAGVFFGKIKERSENEVTMTCVRKLWYWNGACAVEELAVTGTQMPGDCKFTVAVEEMILKDPIQIIPCTEKAVESIKGVKAWTF